MNRDGFVIHLGVGQAENRFDPRLRPGAFFSHQRRVGFVGPVGERCFATRLLADLVEPGGDMRPAIPQELKLEIF